jgi:hypothetical protein
MRDVCLCRAYSKISTWCRCAWNVVCLSCTWTWCVLRACQCWKLLPPLPCPAHTSSHALSVLGDATIQNKQIKNLQTFALKILKLEFHFIFSWKYFSLPYSFSHFLLCLVIYGTYTLKSKIWLLSGVPRFTIFVIFCPILCDDFNI